MKLNKQDFDVLDGLLSKIGFGSYYDCIQVLRDIIYKIAYNFKPETRNNLENETDLYKIISLINRIASKNKRDLNKLEFIFKKVKESGTKNSIKQFVYVIEEIGEIAEILRILDGDERKSNKNKRDLASEIGDTLITLYLIAQFEDLDFHNILNNAIDKEYNRWKSKEVKIHK